MAPLAVDGMHTNFMILHEKVLRYKFCYAYITSFYSVRATTELHVRDYM